MLNSRDISLLRDDVEANCRIWIERCKAAGLNVLVTNTVRDAEYQAYLYEQGRTRPGSIVTNSKTPTFHSDKAGLAFDFCKNVKGQEYSDPNFFKKAAAIAKEMGFSWGGDWKSFVDTPHIQWDYHGTWTSSKIQAGQLPPKMPIYEEEDTMTEAEFYKMFETAMNKYKKEEQSEAVSNSAEFKAAWAKAKAKGVLDGTKPRSPLTREQFAVVADRLNLMD